MLSEDEEPADAATKLITSNETSLDDTLAIAGNVITNEERVSKIFLKITAKVHDF